MSGGSYNYLCHAEADNVLSRTGDLQSMADRLDGVCPEAAAETRALFDGPWSLKAELEKRLARLTDLWHDVEWRDSCDYGDDRITLAVAKFRAQGPTPGAMQAEVARMQVIDLLLRRASSAIAEAERIATRPREAKQDGELCAPCYNAKWFPAGVS